MQDKLKHFIEQHRDDFDNQVPRDLWSGIDHGLKQKNSFIHSKKLANMLKYGFGASALIIGTLVVLNTTPKTENTVSHKNLDVSITNSHALPEQAATETKEEPSALIDKKVMMSPGPDSLPSEEIREDVAEAVPPEPPADPVVPMNAVVMPEVVTPTVMPEKMISSHGSYNPYMAAVKDSSGNDYYKSIDTLFRDVSKLEVMTSHCNITIKAGEGNNVSMKGEVGGAAGNVYMFGTRCYANKIAVLRYEKKDSVLKVWIAEKNLDKRTEVTKKQKKNSEGNFIKVAKNEGGSSYLNFTIPKKIPVYVNSASGHITVDGVEGRKTQLEASYGHITVSDVKTELTIRSGSGHVRVTNMSGMLRSKTSFGHQTITDVTGDALLTSSSGHIHVKRLKGNLDANSSFGHQNFEDLTGDISAVASSGHLYAKEVKGKITSRSSFGKQSFVNIEGDINAQASSGSVEINGSKGTLGISTSFGNIVGRNVKLMSNSEFKTSSGNINMTFLNEINELKFDLRSSSGHVMVEKENVMNKSNGVLSFGEGAILVKGITSFGNQNYH